MKRKIALLLFSVFISLNLAVGTVSAQQSQLGIIPAVPSTITDCKEELKKPEVRNAFKGLEAFKLYVGKESDVRDGLLACAIKTGNIHFFMVPFFAVYVVEFLLGIAGLVAVLFVVYGGFKYVMGGLSQDKETGKKVIFQALQGLAVALSAWIIVNVLQTFLTS